MGIEIGFGNGIRVVLLNRMERNLNAFVIAGSGDKLTERGRGEVMRVLGDLAVSIEEVSPECGKGKSGVVATSGEDGWLVAEISKCFC
jgi:hypothetical protein